MLQMVRFPFHVSFGLHPTYCGEKGRLNFRTRGGSRSQLSSGGIRSRTVSSHSKRSNMKIARTATIASENLQSFVVSRQPHHRKRICLLKLELFRSFRKCQGYHIVLLFVLLGAHEDRVRFFVRLESSYRTDRYAGVLSPSRFSACARGRVEYSQLHRRHNIETLHMRPWARSYPLRGSLLKRRLGANNLMDGPSPTFAEPSDILFLALH